MKNYEIFTSKWYAMNSGVVKDGQDVYIVDPGVSLDEVQLIYRQAYSSSNSNVMVLYTHGDFDHIVGSQSFSNATHVGSKMLMDPNFYESKLSEWRNAHEESPFEIPKPFVLQLDQGISSNTSYTHSIGRIEAFAAKGHTLDSVVYHFVNHNILFVGDYLSDVDIPIIEGSVEGYANTLIKIMKLYKKSKPLIVPGHGTLIQEDSIMNHRYERDMAYIELLRSNDRVGLNQWLKHNNFDDNASHNYHLENLKRHLEKI